MRRRLAPLLFALLLPALSGAAPDPAVLEGALWPCPYAIGYRCEGLSEADRATVRSAAAEWSRHSGVTLQERPDGPVRVVYGEPGAWSWSGIGRHSLSAPVRLAPGFPPSVARHEFGHVLGLVDTASLPGADPEGIMWYSPALPPDKGLSAGNVARIARLYPKAGGR